MQLTPGWSPLPVLIERLRRGVAPRAQPGVARAGAERAIQLMDRHQRAARILASLPAGRDAATTGRDKVRQAIPERLMLLGLPKVASYTTVGSDSTSV